MKTLITIAGTLLAGATPFAASAALGHEAATTTTAQATVATWPVPTQAAQRSEGDELEELRRAIAELRAEKDRLNAELAVKRAEAAEQSAVTGAQWPEIIRESANAAVEGAARQQYEALLEQALQAEKHAAYEQLAEGEYKRAVELHAHLAEVQAEQGELELELHEAQEHLNGLWVHEDGENSFRWETSPQSDDTGLRWHVVVQDDETEAHELQREALERLIEENVAEELNQAAIDALLQQLEWQHAGASEPKTQRRVRHVVIDSDGNRTDAELDRMDLLRVEERSNGERRFGVVTRGSEDGAREVQVDQNVWVEVNGDSRIALISPGDAHSRTFIHDSDRGEQETRVFKSRKIFVRGQDGELVEVLTEDAAPTVPGAPRAVRAPRAPRAPIGLGGGTAPPDEPVKREAIRWRASSSAPGAEREYRASNDRDELLREVHVLTKEMLAELRLLRAAVDELRRDVDASHPAHSGARSGGR